MEIRMYKLLDRLAVWWYLRCFVSMNGWWWREVKMPLDKKAFPEKWLDMEIGGAKWLK